MNTLDKNITRTFFNSDSGFEELQKQWSELVQADKKREHPNKVLQAEHYLIYAALRGKDWRKCFTPISNKNKLANGLASDTAIRYNFFSVNSQRYEERNYDYFVKPHFGNLVSLEGFRNLLKQLPESYGKDMDAYKGELNAESVVASRKGNKQSEAVA